MVRTGYMYKSWWRGSPGLLTYLCIHTVAEILKFYTPAAKITFIAAAGIYIHGVPMVETGRIKNRVGDASKKVCMTDCFI